jgi:hypothetical protein
MLRQVIAILAVFLAQTLTFGVVQSVKSITENQYRDKMMGGWVGQMVGVSWGADVEFVYKGVLLTESEIPVWKPQMVNDAFVQDDLYVEMTFLRTLEMYGLDVSCRQIGIDFANSKYPLYHANEQGRKNLRDGISPPDCSHPTFNVHADDIDYQIEADFSGLIAPGMFQYPIEAGKKFGRLVNYGDGVYGGQFIGAMYSEAFFENDMVKVVENALQCIPSESQYYECIKDVIAAYKADSNDWQKAWHIVDEKYQKRVKYRLFSCEIKYDFNIDAKINGAYVVIGLLYGGGDFEKTIKITMQCGQDSDCNPSSAAGILATSIGFSNLPEKFKQIDRQKKFSYTEYNFGQLVEVCVKLACEEIVRKGGKIEGDKWHIPNQKLSIDPVEKSFNPGLVEGSAFTDEEMKKIKEKNPVEIKRMPPAFVISKFAPGWKVANCGDFMHPGLYEEWEERKGVLVTHPWSTKLPCSLLRELKVPTDGQTSLRFVVGHHENGDFELVVKINEKEVLNEVIGKNTDVSGNHFVERTIVLTPCAGENIKIEIQNKASVWGSKAAYWDSLEIITKPNI